MLIGMGKKKQEPAVAAESNNASPFIFDAVMQDFEERVIRASMTVPMLVDFWAPWCGPCKQLGPVLEQAVIDAKGQVLLAKVNIDDNPELAQALRVQSVPTVFAFFQGQPVTAFAGAKPASEIKALITQLIQLGGQGMGAGPDMIDVPSALNQAASLLIDNKVPEAQQLYLAVLAQEEENPQAYAGIIRTLIAMGEIDQARAMADDAPETVRADASFKAAQTALALAAQKPADGAVEALRQTLQADPADHTARFDLAMALYAGGEADQAIDALLEIVARDRGWEDGKARTQLLEFFDAMGNADPRTLAGRRKLSSLLFS